MPYRKFKETRAKLYFFQERSTCGTIKARKSITNLTLATDVSLFLLWDTCVQGHKLLPRKSVHIIFVFATSIEGTLLFRGRGYLFLGSEARF